MEYSLESFPDGIGLAAMTTYVFSQVRIGATRIRKRLVINYMPM